MHLVTKFIFSQLGSTIGTMVFAFYLLDRFSGQPGYASMAEMVYSAPTLLVFLILFLRSAVAKFFAPAESALIQGVLSKEQYVQASGINQMLFGVFTLFGTSLGALTYTAVGITGAVGIDGCGFAVLPLFTMKYKLAEGHYETYVSLFTLFLGIGFLLGSVIGSALVQRFKFHNVIMYGMLLCGLLTALLGIVNHAWLYLAVVLLAGIIMAPVNMALGGWLPQLVESSKMGRVSAWIDPVMMFYQTLMLGMITLFFPSILSLGMIYSFLAAIQMRRQLHIAALR
ncbi:hypothetical protein [Paenibacillus beijingensis]|uniref:Uncharacterized protein n=1 Tax=Paenibacillus beijingensis TaxID=1126833 RepID=A0A0D5NH01_9BACL|nr:hypothetical protein [Paenibacillus beijingensis]AJY74649.1 hypothetical protein VN24_08755 [Paenibacillus beijingensis]